LSLLPIPFEIILIIGIAADIALAYFGINLFKSLRKRLKARKQR
jgi:hypothetical protein